MASAAEDGAAASASGGAGGAGGAASGGGDAAAREGAVDVYHERQERMYCARHALNAMVAPSGGDAEAAPEPALVTTEELDGIAEELAAETEAAGIPKPGLLGFLGFSPHRSALGLGNWDVNVVLRALRRRGLHAAWFDRRKGVDALPLGDVDTADGALLGVIVNRRSRYMLVLTSYHWFTLRLDAQGVWWNCDSALARPKRLGGADDARAVVAAIDDADANIIVVRRPPPAAAAAPASDGDGGAAGAAAEAPSGASEGEGADAAASS